MKYYEVNFSISPLLEAYSDVLSASLAEIGFESFVPTDDGLSAYIQQSVFDKEKLETAIGEFPIDDIRISYEVTEAEYEDWNAVWEEEGFQPIVIDDIILIV